MWVIPNLSPLPFGGKIEQTSFDDAFIEEMATISKHHGMWAKLMGEVIDQAVTKESDVPTIAKMLLDSSGTRNRDPCRAASKGFRSATIPTSAPFVKISSLGQKFPEQQATLHSYFEHNPTPARTGELPADVEEPVIQVISTAATDAATNGPDKEFYRVMIETMKNLQSGAPIQNQKIVLKSCDHEETVDAAKLQTSMVRLMYASTKTVDWAEGTIESVLLGTFTQEFKNLLERSAAVQVMQLTNLVKTIFTIESEDDDDDGPLNRLMSLYVFPAKFLKGHLNAAFQSNDLELAAMHKSTSINPFHYGPQNNQAMVIAARKEQEEEQNEKNFSIIETQCKKIWSLIEGIGKINSMEDVAMTCTNICGVQLAIINIASGKPLLYQYRYKMICFIKNKKITRWYARNAHLLMRLHMLFMAKIHQFFLNLVLFSQNSVNTNLVEHGATGDELNISNVVIAVKFAVKFWKKMNDHIKDDTIPKEIPPFASSMFFENAGVVVATAAPVAINKSAETPAALNQAKGKKSGKEPRNKKQKQETSNKSLKMGLIHMEKGASVAAVLPEKGNLKENICLDFCSHDRNCNLPHLLCKNGKHYTTWKIILDENKAMLLAHMDGKKKMRLDSETFSKHKVAIAPKFLHLLGDASGPKQKSSKSA